MKENRQENAQVSTSVEEGKQREMNADDYDEELIALPSPPPPLWYGLFTAAIIVLSVVMLFWFWPDMQFLLKSVEGPVELGDAASLDVADLKDNSYVTIEGIPWMSRTAQFTLTGTVNWSPFTDNKRKAFPITGQPNIIVFWKESAKHKAYRDPKKNPVRPFMPSFFEGHLQRVSSVHSNYDKVWRYFEKELKVNVGEHSFLLTDGEVPSDKWWAALAYLLLLGMITINIFVLKRFVTAWKA